MAKYDEQLNKMLSLMEDKRDRNKVSNGIEYYTNGADGKVYGIIKEGNKYYIKTSEVGKENLLESYEYINGFMCRKENEFKNYNEATKQLELKLISLNEAYGKHEDVSTVDFKREEKSLAYLTEESRKDIDRINQIFENSCKIGKDCICDLEPKGKSKAEETIKNNAPFEIKADATLEKDPSFKGSVKTATENTDVNNIENDLTSDKMKQKNSGSIKDYKDAHSDLEGESVADKKVKGAKGVKMNESLYEDDVIDLDDLAMPEENEEDVDFNYEDDIDNEDEIDSYDVDGKDNTALNDTDTDIDTDIDGEFDDTPSVGDDIVGQGDEAEEDEEDLDSLLEDFKNAITNGPNAVLDGKQKKEKKESPKTKVTAQKGSEETLKSFGKKGSLPAQACNKEKLTEAINSIVSDVYKKLTEDKKSKKPELNSVIDKLVKEEITKLNVWGKHPGYRKQPFQVPSSSKIKRFGEEWDDESVKTEKPYGEKIGNGAPFEKIVNMLTDQVLSQIKENIK